ncbi:MAG: type II toxin-antitoxin system VapC family toxin [Phycisphaerae bacterium]|nr:type II toxin-antitoxin system VapC family toxin [Phycisphaerae bacterium]
MKPSVYLETTIASYLSARPSRDLVVAANQALTREWWTDRSHRFDLFVSQIVLDEAAGGDVQAAGRRLELLEGPGRLDVTEPCLTLGRAILRGAKMPARAATDALHVAIAAVHQMTYLLTWNCTHIANASMRQGIESVCVARGFRPPVICTPLELMEV